MAVNNRTEIPKLLTDIKNGSLHQVYLFFGERYLCREGADQLQATLLQQNSGTIHPIDGDQEDHNKTLNQIMSFSLLPGQQIYRVTDSKIFLSKSVAPEIWKKAEQAFHAKKHSVSLRLLRSLLSTASLKLDEEESLSEFPDRQWKKVFGFSKPSNDIGWADTLLKKAGPQKSGKSTANIGTSFLETIEKGLPPQNILILTVETVDKRQKLFTLIKKLGQVIDCSVDTGASSAAQKIQKDVLKELISKTLKGFNKKIEPKALDMFFDRVGFHPVGLVMETEKLALFTDGPLITCRDLEEMVGRSREDALFELTDSFSKRQVAKSMVTLSRLLDNGVHGLAILATMRNYIRKLLIFRSLQLQSSPIWQRGMQANHFQKSYLPALKESGQWPEMLKGHPYALYMSFSKAAEFSCPALKDWLSLLLQAESRLKGSPLDQKLVLQELFLSMFAKKRPNKI